MSDVDGVRQAAVERRGAGVFDYTAHEGAPMQVQWYFLDRSALPVAVQMWELPPGGSEGMHEHSGDEPLEELYVVVEGRAEMTVAGDKYVLGPGDAALAGVGEDHDLHNVGDGRLRVLIVWGTPGQSDWSRFRMAGVARAASAD